ncbi:MAG TPA: pantetheine-phosphate adenylyltransferase [Symbiobacteriaceae bacterium]|nr:pantetheine-phosphate adenylyltransferase [Symbiobacteriaceae bacterium]
MKKAICPGSFDPVTNGHLDIIRRAARTFDHVTVAILHNPRKAPLFTLEERMEMLRACTQDLPNVSVESATGGLLVDFARSRGAQSIVKGLRPIQDFEYEWQMGMVNMQLNDEVETYFLMSRSEYSYLSSSIVRELASLGGKLEGLVPPLVEQRLRSKFNGK